MLCMGRLNLRVSLAEACASMREMGFKVLLLCLVPYGLMTKALRSALNEPGPTKTQTEVQDPGG